MGCNDLVLKKGTKGKKSNKIILSTNEQKKIRADGTNELQNGKQHKCKPIETKVRLL